MAVITRGVISANENIVLHAFLLPVSRRGARNPEARAESTEPIGIGIANVLPAVIAFVARTEEREESNNDLTVLESALADE